MSDPFSRAATISPVLCSVRVAIVASAMLFAACGGGGGSGGPPPPAPAPANTHLDPTEDPPGVVLEILGLTGASAADGSFRAGDQITVHFTLRKNDGSPWGVGEMDLARALVSGPTFNYQRVIAEQEDLKMRAVYHGNGSYSYTFGPPVPAVYLPPYNDTLSFGAIDGELAGKPLLGGTYTVGLSFVWAYTVEQQRFLDVGETSLDFRFGGAGAIHRREVTRRENCNECHVSLQAHDGTRKSVTLCLMCHTAGAEDKNYSNVANGTPDVTINSRVLFHKLHNGRHLPSVLGVGTIQQNGVRNYDLPLKPYVLVNEHLEIRDYSSIGFPAWPNRTIPMPRDTGYQNLGLVEQALEDEMRRGVTRCDACHGDPDGAGPLGAPADGDLVYRQPTRAACGSCHDDVNWSLPYKSNGDTMPPQADDSLCVLCHEVTAGAYAVFDKHLHPLVDETITQFGSGFTFKLLDVSESGAANGNGSLDPGEKVSVMFRLEDAASLPVSPSDLDAISAVMSGPTRNANLLLRTPIPRSILVGAQPFTIHLPELRQLEFVGDSTSATPDVFATSFAPHLNATDAKTLVLVRIGTGGGSTQLSAGVVGPQNFLDVLDASGFDRGDWVVLEDGVIGAEEYAQVQFTEGNRLWFSSPETPEFAPGVFGPHPAGAAVQEVALQLKTEIVDYSIDPNLGQITEELEFGDGAAVLVTYTTDFVMPQIHPLAANDSPDLDETSGKWTGKTLVAGTYRVGLSGYQDTLFPFTVEPNPYRVVARAATRDVLVGSATSFEPYALISSESNCYACHTDLWFHDGQYRGFDACILCHGNAGSEDRPRYVAANAPATPGVTANFRTLLHQIHSGSQLTNAATFTVVGSGPAPYPDNFTANKYEKILFPAMPGAAMNCEKCHGTGNTAWLSPGDRNHPTQQILPVRAWRAACATCHDSAEAFAHIDVFTTPAGIEGCGDCHDPGQAFEVRLVHKVR